MATFRKHLRQRGVSRPHHFLIKTMYHVGQKINWLTVIDGSITKVIGEITQIVGEWIWVKGKTLCKNEEVTDRLTIYDKSIDVYQ